MFNIAEFNSILSKNNGVQHASLYSVEIPIPPVLRAASPVTGGALTTTANELKFYCQGTGIPGMQLATSQIRRYGYGPLEEKPFLPLFAPSDMRFLADGKGAIWNFFELWMKCIVNHDTRFGINTPTGLAYTGDQLSGSVSATMNPYELNYKRDYAVDVVLRLYNPKGEVTVSIVLRDAYPKFIGDAPLSWGDANNVVLVPVQFTFIDWYNMVLAGDGSLSFDEIFGSLDAVSSLLVGQATTVLSQNDLQLYTNSILNNIRR